MTIYTPTWPEYDRLTSFVTYQDAVERVLVQFSRQNTGRDAMLARQAVGDALLRLSRHPWKFYRSMYQLKTVAEYTTGTIAYTHSTRTVTLTGGTWPSSAAMGTVLIDSVPYPVASRDSDTQLTLREDMNPGDDVASGTSYKWYQDCYILPPDFESMSDPLDAKYQTGGPDLIRVDSETLASLGQMVSYVPVAYPQYYTIERDPRYGKVIRLAPPPSSERTYLFVYRRRPRRLSVVCESTGTITASTSSTTVTGSGTSWTSSYVGCVLRAGTDSSSEPTGPYGAMIGVDPSDVQTNPAVFERIITGVTDATTLTIDVAPDTSVSGVKYTISDPIDVDWTIAGEYFNRLVEYMMTVVDMDISPELRSMKKALQREAFILAADRDRVQDSIPRAPYDWDWADFAGEHNVSTNDYVT